MKTYRSKYGKTAGSAYGEAIKFARAEYHAIQKRSPRRQPYIRSRYFGKEKVFINVFWEHLDQKNRADRLRRLKLYRCAIDTIRHSTCSPEVVTEATKPHVLLYRFTAMTSSGEYFYVQIKENKRTNRKDFMSAFPATNIATK